MANQTPVFKIEVKGTQDVIRLQQELAKAKKEAKATTDKTEFDRLAAEIVKLTGQLKNARREQNQAVNSFLATDKATGAYKRLSAQLNSSKKELKDLAAAGKTNTVEFKKLLTDTRRLDGQLKKIDASLGDFGRNVGNYAGSLKGLFGGLRQTVRQSALLRSVPNLFFQISGAVDSLTKGIDLYNETFDSSYVTAKRVQEATEGLTSEYIKEEVQLRGLVDTAKGENATKEQRKLAVDALQEQYPEYFSNLDRENININELTAGYEKANAELIKNLKAKVRASIIEKQLQDAVQKRLEATAIARQAEAQAALQGFDAQGLIIKGLSNLQAQQADISANTAKSAASNIDQVDASLEEVFATLKDVVDDASLAFDNSEDNLKKLASSTTKEQKKLNDKVQKEAEAAAKKQAETLKKLQKEQEDFIVESASKRLDLNKQIQQAIIDQIEDEGQKATAQEMFNFQDRAATREAELKKLLQQSKDLERQIADTAGTDSDQAKEAAAKGEAERLELVKQFNALALQEKEVHKLQLLKLEKKASEDELQEAIQGAEMKRSELDIQYSLTEERLKQSLANSLIDQAEYESQSIAQQRAYLQEQKELIQQQLDAGLFADEAAKQQLILQQEQLNTELAQLQQKQTEKTAEESEKRKEKLLQDIETALNATKQVLGAISDILVAQQEAEAKRFEEQIETRNKNLETLNAQLQDASGLQKAFLEAQIKEEVRLTEELEAKKAAAEKKAAKTKKATSILEAIINTALGVTSALSLPFPLNFITAATVGIVGGAQIATIARQPLAKGGFTGTGIGQKDGTGFKQAGVVHEGEWVAPKWMVESPNFSPVINSLESNRKTRGFAAGGFTSPQVPMPMMQGTSSGGADVGSMVNAIDRKTDAISNRIDKIEVIYTTRTQAAIDQDKKEVKQIKNLNKL